MESPCVSTSLQPLFSFGSRGKAQVQFNYPYDIAIDENTGNVAVADNGNDRVQLFNSEGKYLSTVSNKKIIQPTSVAFTRSSNLIVIATRKIFLFDERRQLVTKITNKHLKKPDRLTIVHDGRMVVCDWGDPTVKVLSPDGTKLLLTISDPDHAAPCFAISHEDIFVVSYFWEDNVKVFNNDGVFLYNIGTPGSGDGQLHLPAGLAVDRFSNLVVCDSGNSRLQVFMLDGKLDSIIELGLHSGLRYPDSVVVSPSGQLCIVDVIEHCVRIFQ